MRHIELKKRRKQNAAPIIEEADSAPAAVSALREVFADCQDFEARTVMLGGAEGKMTAAVCFFDGLVSSEAVARDVLRPATDEKRLGNVKTPDEAAELMLSGAVYGATAKRRTELSDVVSDLLNGSTALVFGESGLAVTFETKSTEKRSISEPKEEKVVKGAKDVFIETIRTNTMLVRRRLRDRRLKLRTVTVGDDSNTTAAIFYINGLTDMATVSELEARLRAIRTDGALSAGDIEEYITDSPRSPFPQLLRTERPDRFCMNLLEGRAGLLIDGLPLGYLAPGTFAQFMKVPEDSANHFIVASVLTLLRYFALGVTLFLPAFYVAVAMFHQEMLPTKLMQSVITSKASVPFPTGLEAIMMLVAFELLQEAGLRLPNPVGETVSIIGALIVGQSAVEAKVISPVIVIVIALAGVSGYVVPNQDLSSALRLCRFLLVLLAILCGMFGIAVGAAMLIYHLCSLESFGVPYMSPFSGGGMQRVFTAILRRPMPGNPRRDPDITEEDGVRER